MALQKAVEPIALEKLVLRIQHGDKELHNYLLKTYKPFLIKTISQVCKRYIDPSQDDEFSIGLLAFNDSIFLYQPERGSSFLSFAKLVVTRKVIDYIRYQARREHLISFDDYYDEGTMENKVEVKTVIEQYKDELDRRNRREETKEFDEKLKEYDLSIRELVKVAPKHKDTRQNAIKIARILLDNPNLKNYVETRKKLPIKQLEPLIHVSKKTVERNRKYILAVFIVLNSNFNYLKEYVTFCEKGKPCNIGK
jgi:RNA polymerase sigma factor